MIFMLRVAAIVTVVSASVQDAEWDQFKAKYKKTYKGDADEQQRYKLFLASKDRVAKLNELNGQPAFGINWMSDRLETEKHKKGLKKPKDFKPTAPVKDFTATMRSPASIDWRFAKAVTPVKNQDSDLLPQTSLPRSHFPCSVSQLLPPCGFQMILVS